MIGIDLAKRVFQLCVMTQSGPIVWEKRLRRSALIKFLEDEAPLTGGFGAEIAARIAERALTSLLAPIERVTGWDTVMPLPRLEQYYLPSEARILAAARRILAYQ